MTEAVQLVVQSMQSDVEYLRAISSNLANIGTSAYKREVVIQSMAPGETSFSGVLDQDPEIYTSSQRVFKQGAIKSTENSFNLAIEGDGFFLVASSEGEMLTRVGDIKVDLGGFISLVSGEKLQGAQGNVFVGQMPFEITANGEIIQQGRVIDRLKVVELENPGAARYAGNGLISSNSSSKALDPVSYRVRQGYVEASNVDAMYETLKMIEVMRHFETSSRIFRVYDEMLGHSLGKLGEF